MWATSGINDACIEGLFEGLRFWEGLVNSEIWAQFASRGFHSWLQWNFECHAIRPLQTPWNTLFGVTLDALWRDKISFVFQQKTILEHGSMQQTWSLAWLIQ